MQRLVLSTHEVFPYLWDLEDLDIDATRDKIPNGYDFYNQPPIPVFEIPQEFRLGGWRYILPDGNHRWLKGHVTSAKVLAVLFAPNEPIDISLSGIAPFPHSNKSDLFDKTLKIYKKLNKII